MSLYDEVRRIVHEETIYLRHYKAKVLKIEEGTFGDSKTVKVLCVPYDLGLFSANEGIWAYPRQGLSVYRPKKDEYVELYFLAGDPNQPVYLYPVVEIKGNGFKYIGSANEDVIYTDRITQNCSISYFFKKKILHIFGKIESIIFESKKFEVEADSALIDSNESIIFKSKKFEVEADSTLIDSNEVDLAGTGGQGVARLNDDVRADAVSDPAFFTWVAAVSSSLGSLGFPVAPVPAQVSSKITSASVKVKSQ